MLYLIKRNSKGKPEPKKERSIILQFNGNCFLLTLNPQQSHILIILVLISGPIILALR